MTNFKMRLEKYSLQSKDLLHIKGGGNTSPVKPPIVGGGGSGLPPVTPDLVVVAIVK